MRNYFFLYELTLSILQWPPFPTSSVSKRSSPPSPILPTPQKEVLTTRWANEDPNPTQILAVKRSHMNAFEKAAIASWEALPEEQKRARIQQLQMADALKTGRAISDYPSTDMQVCIRYTVMCRLCFILKGNPVGAPSVAHCVI